MTKVQGFFPAIAGETQRMGAQRALTIVFLLQVSGGVGGETSLPNI